MLDSPKTGQTIRGNTTISGWAFDNTQVARVDVLVDGIVSGTATYGTSRTDVATAYPNAPSAIGFRYTLNTKRYANGIHSVTIRATDPAGNVAILPTASVTIKN
jgi:N-acetylmuramoyl-L-alanine amidase